MPLPGVVAPGMDLGAASKGLPQSVDIAVGAAHIHTVPCHRGGGKNGPYRHQLLDARNHVVIEKVGEGRFVVWSTVRFGVGGAVLLGIFGFESPRDFLSLEVDGVEPALMRANVQGLAGEENIGQCLKSTE